MCLSQPGELELLLEVGTLVVIFTAIQDKNRSFGFYQDER